MSKLNRAKRSQFQCGTFYSFARPDANMSLVQLGSRSSQIRVLEDGCC